MTQAAATRSGFHRLRPAGPSVTRAFLRRFTFPTGYWLLGFAVLSVSPLMAKAPNLAPQSAAAASPGAAAVQPPTASSTGDEVNKQEPSPSTEDVTWDGKTWSVIDKPLFEARFKRYLDAPEETAAEDAQYQAIISKILELTAPGNASPQNVDAALRLLPRASRFGIDSRLCDALADAVRTGFRCLRSKELFDAERAAARRKAQEAERAAQPEWKMRLLGAGKSVTDGDTTPATGTAANATVLSAQRSSPDGSAQMQGATPLPNFEAEAKVDVRPELFAIQAKVEFQALIVQLFLQRRFQHVLMATRFYRAVFPDGDAKLYLGKDFKDLFEKGRGTPVTLDLLESLANEGVRHVHEDVQAYEFLAQKGDLENAVKRLAQGFTVGEYLPEIGALPREMKHRALDILRDPTGAPQP